MVHRPLPALRASIAVAACAAGAMSCAVALPQYKEPAPDAPHALIKLRIVHHATPGPMHSTSVVLNDTAIALPSFEPGTPLMRALRVRPEQARWRLATEFFHYETKTETYTTTEQYQCGSTTSGSGSYTYSTPQYCSRTVTRTRTVQTKVSDGSCAATLEHLPAAGDMQLVQFEFTGPSECAARCFVQKPREDEGGFSLEPCIGSRVGPGT